MLFCSYNSSKIENQQTGYFQQNKLHLPISNHSIISCSPKGHFRARYSKPISLSHSSNSLSGKRSFSCNSHKPNPFADLKTSRGFAILLSRTNNKNKVSINKSKIKIIQNKNKIFSIFEELQLQNNIVNVFPIGNCLQRIFFHKIFFKKVSVFGILLIALHSRSVFLDKI